MLSTPGNALSGNSPASVLSEKISAVVKAHYDGLAQQEHTELEYLRVENLQLRGELAKRIQIVTTPENGDMKPARASSSLAGSRASSSLAGSHTDGGNITLAVSSRFKFGRSIALSSTSKTDSAVKSVLPSSALTSSALASSGLASVATGDSADDGGHSSCALGSDIKAGTRSGYYPNATSSALVQNSDLSSFSSAQHVRTLEAAEAEMMDLKKKFHELAPKKKGYIDIDQLGDHMTQHLPAESDEKKSEMRKYKTAIHKLNKKIGLLAHVSSTHSKNARNHINFSAFRMLMLEDVDAFHLDFGEMIAEALLEIRATLISDVIVQQVAKTWRVSADDVEHERGMSVQTDTVLQYLEPLVAFMIMLNALCIGVSLDFSEDWYGWFVLESFFACFFLIEVVIRVRVHGCADHFFGQDWAWSWFDFSIVCFAVLEKTAALLDEIGVSSIEGTILKYMVVLRLARLIRIGRVIGNLRFKIFKELTLMINGIFAGLRTLFWASVLLTLFIYAFAVLTRQIMDPENHNVDCASASLSQEDSAKCNRGVENMELYGHLLFGSVGRAMLTIFTCFTDSCISPDGTPLIWHLWDTHGPLLVMGYVAAFLFVSFGVLSLIMAVFVENTLANAHQQNAERQFGEISTQVRKAVQLQMLLMKFCKANNSVKQMPKTSLREQSRVMVQKYLCCKKRSKAELLGFADAGAGFHPDYVQARITQDQFEDMLIDAEVQELLDELDISCISREQLFDIIDADGNGFLAISEIVDGIMKLRGPADKGDGVATVLAVRQLQKQVSKFEEHMQKHFKVMDNFCRKLELPPQMYVTAI